MVWLASNTPAAAQQPPAPAPESASQPDSGQTPPDQNQEEEDSAVLKTVPELPKIPEVQMPGEKGISIGLSLWTGNPKPELEKGSFDYQYLGNIRMMGTPKIDPGGDMKIALGLHNVLWGSFQTTRASGNVYAPSELGLITQVYLQGDYLATDYRLTSFKMGFDYLAWPYPVKTSRFRLKTRYSMQFLRARIGFDAPLLPVVDAYGNPLTNATTGGPLSYATVHTYQFYIPEFGSVCPNTGLRAASGWRWGVRECPFLTIRTVGISRAL